jgi:hypothetical protein
LLGSAKSHIERQFEVLVDPHRATIDTHGCWGRRMFDQLRPKWVTILIASEPSVTAGCSLIALVSRNWRT